MTRRQEDVERVTRLRARGLSQSAIARRTGIPRRTVCDWISGKIPTRKRRSSTDEPLDPSRAMLRAFAQPRHYAYLLGLYLGDGCISQYGRQLPRLRIVLDASYPGIVDEALVAIGGLLPERPRSARRRPNEAAVDVSSYSAAWPILFPQHGSGRKHTRPIRLEQWQRAITSTYPHEFLRGLIHSDGSRCVVRQRSRGHVCRYARYMFRNRSRDIRELFTEHLEVIGIPWTYIAEDGIQIARRGAVQALDEFIGPKR